jgi:hypothetical protein
MMIHHKTESPILQLPNVAWPQFILEDMAIDKELKAFAARMNEICDDMGVPPKGKGRQTTIAARFTVSQRAALKWLEGETYPSVDHARAISRWSGVRFEWLMTGEGDKKTGYRTSDSSIQHVVSVMQAMEPEQRYLVSSVVDTISKSRKGN